MNASLCDAPKSNGNTLEPNATQVICATRSHTKLRPHFCIATNHSGQFERLNWGDAIEAMTWKFASSDNHELKRNLLKESQCWCSHWHHDVYTADVLILNINNNGSEDNITIHGHLQACTINTSTRTETGLIQREVREKVGLHSKFWKYVCTA